MVPVHPIDPAAVQPGGAALPRLKAVPCSIRRPALCWVTPLASPATIATPRPNPLEASWPRAAQISGGGWGEWMGSFAALGRVWVLGPYASLTKHFEFFWRWQRLHFSKLFVFSLFYILLFIISMFCLIFVFYAFVF